MRQLPQPGLQPAKIRILDRARLQPANRRAHGREMHPRCLPRPNTCYPPSATGFRKGLTMPPVHHTSPATSIPMRTTQWELKVRSNREGKEMAAMPGGAAPISSSAAVAGQPHDPRAGEILRELPEEPHLRLRSLGEAGSLTSLSGAASLHRTRPTPRGADWRGGVPADRSVRRLPLAAGPPRRTGTLSPAPPPAVPDRRTPGSRRTRRRSPLHGSRGPSASGRRLPRTARRRPAEAHRAARAQG